jgi:polar amino acid transport system substrate-binding protein
MLLLICAVIFWNRSLKREVSRRTNELALQQQQLLLADKMSSLGTLVSGVAHEINNPTGLILYNLPVLEKVYQTAEVSLEDKYLHEGDFFIGGLKYSILREESAKMFAEMQEGATRIKRIVDDLKDFARKDSSDLSGTLYLNDVVCSAVRLVDSSIKKATNRFSMDCSDSLPPFQGNSQRVEQVIINILLNACQALSDPDQGIYVKTYLDEKANELVLEIKDEGGGIASEHLAHLTDPFYTTKREAGGTGLGLSISAGILEEHQGRLDFNSELGVGTVVSMRLPKQKGTMT